ncbi:hypothetical protein [Bacillus sp. ISL-45]|uniref:hypothetical protein n=1 Tax=Bacillus sp. ISL-45 TaxID=2819128 RepID=UPI001BE75ED7|nr:hypothetical protein [Bacillus sp. ISL-45]MBT2661633.1 hypothetical protein [Bacillus sp. ISL-45]
MNALDKLKNIINELELPKPRYVEELDGFLVRMSVDKSTKFTLFIGVDSEREILNFIIPDIKQINKSRYNEVAKKLLEFNHQKLMYGSVSMGENYEGDFYLISYSNAIYTKRDNDEPFTISEFKEYVGYAGYVYENIQELVKE